MGDIVWLASYPKSGNTWLRAFLCNLLRDPDQPVDINTLDQFAFGDAQTHWYRSVAGKPVDRLSDAELVALRPQVHRHMTRRSPDSVFVKTHNYFGTALGQPLITLGCTAGAIYVVRNPLDVAVSVSHFYAVDLDRAIALMNDPKFSPGRDDTNVAQYFGTWSVHVESWTVPANPAFWTVRFEDMVSNATETFAGIAKFLGLDPPPDRLRKAIEFSSFRELRRQEQTRTFKEGPRTGGHFFRQGRTGQWRTALSAAQVDAVIAAHGPQMDRLGYLPEQG